MVKYNYQGDREVRSTNQCAGLLPMPLFIIIRAILSRLKLKYEAEEDHKALALLKRISPVNLATHPFSGTLYFSGDKIIDLDAIINKSFLTWVKKKSY